MALKSWLVIGFLGLSFIAGVVGEYVYPGMDFAPSDKWFMPVSALLLFFWYRVDSEQRSYKRSPWMNICIIGFAIFAMPYYFFRTRGFKGGLIASVVMLLIFVAGAVITGAGQYIVSFGMNGF